MIGALIYLQMQSVRNRLRMRLRRLKKPRYLAGAAVGAAYFYFFFFRGLFGGRSSPAAAADAAVPETLLLFELIGALALFLMVLSAWIFPHERAALLFSEAEIAFLFPAPVTRRTLIHFKLLRSQIAILFTTFFLTLVSGRFGQGGKAWIHAAGWWLILSTLSLHTLAASFARTRLLELGVSNWRRRILVLAAVGLLVAAVLLWVKSAVPAPAESDFASIEALKYYLRHALESGPALYALIPFRLIARPYLAPDAAAFVAAFIPAAVLMLLHYWWVVRADVAFEEASVELSRKFAERIAAVRAGGGWHSVDKPKKRKSPPFALQPTGIYAVAFLWKNLISAGHAFTLRTWIFLALFAVCAGVPIGLTSSSTGWLLPAVGILTVLFTGYSVLLGPALLRQDLRQDLANADILKMYPLRGWQVVLGELLAPAAILTGVQWCLVLLAAATFSRFPDDNPIPLSTRLSLGATVAILAPMVNLVSLLIPNASVLLFPAWMQTGRQHVGGIEVMGQRLIFMIGSVLVFAFALVPAAVLFGLVYFFVQMFLGEMLAAPFGAVIAAIVLAAEASLAIWWMGRLFERFDLSAEMAG
jgi:hypothetical protein